MTVADHSKLRQNRVSTSGSDSDQSQFLSYYDSAVGIPDTQGWETLVCLHGYKYRSLIFERLVPYANAHHVRLLLVDRRGYGESSPLTYSEDDGVDPASSGVLSFMQARGLELARFILQVAESVYKHNKNSRSKINHLGWSNGNRSIISMLGSCDAYPKDIVVRLQRVVGSIILWECPYGIFGLPDPPQMYHPLHDKSLSPQEALAAFDDHAGGYFEHGPDFSNDSLEYRYFRPDKLPTLKRMSSLERYKVVEKLPPDYELITSRLAKASGTMEKLTRDAFGMGDRGVPLISSDITLLWAAETLWEVPLAANGLGTLLRNNQGQHVQFRMLPEGNHFLHWDNATLFMDAIVKILNDRCVD